MEDCFLQQENWLSVIFSFLFLASVPLSGGCSFRMRDCGVAEGRVFLYLRACVGADAQREARV